MSKIEIVTNFIVFEGLDGAGTTTQANLLEEKYNSLNIPCINSCEPTRGFIGKAIREVLSGDIKVASGTIAKLFVSDRHEHLYNPKDGILSRCKAGDFVISDRYLFSSLAYQSLDYGFDNVMELELDIAPLSGIPYKREEDIITPLTKLNIKELSIGAPILLIKELDNIFDKVKEK